MENTIIEQANLFAYEVEEYDSIDDIAHRLQSLLIIFYDNQDKIKFLKRAKKQISTYKEKHELECQNKLQCDRLKKWNNSVFLLNQEISKLEKLASENMSSVKEQKIENFDKLHYTIYIETVSQNYNIYFLDFLEVERVIDAYNSGKTSIFINGKKYYFAKLKTIKIFATSEIYEDAYMDNINQIWTADAYIDFVYDYYGKKCGLSIQALSKFNSDVTKHFIKGDFGEGAKAISLPETSQNQFDNKKIFVVHGHDREMKLDVARFIENKLKLNAVILHELPNKGSRTIIEKLESNSDAGFAVVLLSPDDECISNGKSIKRARQNVIFELGYFIGKLGRERVVAIYKYPVDIHSDFSGVLFIDYNTDWQMQLLTEIKEAGLKTLI